VLLRKHVSKNDALEGIRIVRVSPRTSSKIGRSALVKTCDRHEEAKKTNHSVEGSRSIRTKARVFRLTRKIRKKKKCEEEKDN